MNKISLFLNKILIFICLLVSGSIYAEEVSSYLFIQYEDNKIIELKLSKDFLIENQSGILEISGSSLENSIMLPLNRISLIGFLYKEETETDDAGIDSFIDNQTKDLWQIFDIKGRLIRESESEKPDLRNLPPGNIFIIKNRSSSNTFKYIPYK